MSKTNLLSKKQKSWLESLARKAWQARKASGATDETYDAYRRAQAVKACGFRISEAPRAAFDALLAHFQAENGELGKAFDRLAGPSNDQRFYIAQIDAQLRRGGMVRATAKSIAHDKFQGQTDLEKLTPDQLKQLLITLRNHVNSTLERRPLVHAQA